MAIPVNSTSPSDRVLKRLEREHREEEDAKATVWVFLWTLFVFKIATILLIWHGGRNN